MLTQLFIRNIAVIEKSSIDFESGFTVLTGETGAGKSIIIDAIHAVLGERASKELIRTGAKAASVTALFSAVDKEVLQAAESMGIPLEEEDTLLIHRDIKSEGKSVCKINGYPVTVSMLKELGNQLISIHGQHESYELLSSDAHLKYIDSFAELENLSAAYAAAYAELRKIQKALDSFNVDEGEKARKVDLLKYQIEEIAGADIKPGEQKELQQERDRVRNSEKIETAVEKAKLYLAGDEVRGGILSDLTELSTELDKLSHFAPEMADTIHKIEEALYMLEDAEMGLRAVNTEFDSSLLDEIEARLDLIYKLSLKYGEDEEAILGFLETCETELHKIQFSEEERQKLEADYEAVKQQAIDLAKKLSEKRKKAAVGFCSRVKKELNFLNMPGIVFQAEIERIPLNHHGCDKIQFLVSTNKGEPPKPMTKIASGGELSRIMLAIKTVLAGKDKIETLIFDEVDTGISGEAANKVGLKLKEVSKNRQVICITHLAQIAALADNHLLISKHEEKDRTYTEVSPLDTEGRKNALARIIGGDKVTAIQLDMAAEMLKQSIDN